MPRCKSHDRLAQLHCRCYLIAFTASGGIAHTIMRPRGFFAACHPQGQEIPLLLLAITSAHQQVHSKHKPDYCQLSSDAESSSYLHVSAGQDGDLDLARGESDCLLLA
jgi:hypothetical protein